VEFRFPAETCASCPLRAQCTTSTDVRIGRRVTVGPHEELLAEARARQQTDEFKTIYNGKRPTVERVIYRSRPKRGEEGPLPRPDQSDRPDQDQGSRGEPRPDAAARAGVDSRGGLGLRVRPAYSARLLSSSPHSGINCCFDPLQAEWRS
jgi:hypothetical protein